MWGKEVPYEVMVMSQLFSSGLILLGHDLGKHFSLCHLWRDRKATRVWGLAMVRLSRSNKTLKGCFYSICFCCRTDFELTGNGHSPTPFLSKRKLSTLDWGYNYLGVFSETKPRKVPGIYPKAGPLGVSHSQACSPQPPAIHRKYFLIDVSSRNSV